MVYHACMVEGEMLSLLSRNLDTHAAVRQAADDVVEERQQLSVDYSGRL